MYHININIVNNIISAKTIWGNVSPLTTKYKKWWLYCVSLCQDKDAVEFKLDFLVDYIVNVNIVTSALVQLWGVFLSKLWSTCKTFKN